MNQQVSQAHEGSGAPTGGGAVSVRHTLSLLEALSVLPPRVARRHGLIPLRYEGDRLIVGARDPLSPAALDALRRLGHADAQMERISEERYREVIGKWYGPTGEVAEFVSRLSPRPSSEPSVHPGEPLEQTPAPRFLDLTLKAALAEGASDVHLEPDLRSPRVRFRVDGVLVDRVGPPQWLADRVVGRVKALAGLALGECNFAQEGQLLFPTQDGPVSIRVSVLPSDRGECVVLRLLTVEDDVPALEELGVPADVGRRLVRAASSHEGLIVFAGPTGSGKTTTLHSLLRTVDAGDRNIVSIEEPVEIRSRRIRQIPVHREVGLDFAGALRVVLRQDPDVILVGETRDAETAQLVIQAALAGHLVLTTVHTSSALQVFDRLTQLGADRSLLSQVARVNVSQRLLRRVCPHCAGRTCFTCEGTGLKGRIGVFEMVTMDGRLAAAVREGATQETLRQAARAGGYRSLPDRARDLVLAGISTDAEVARVLDLEDSAGGAGGARP